MSIESLSTPARSEVDIAIGGGDVTLAKPSKGIYVGVTGNLEVELMDERGVSHLHQNVQQGSVYPLRVHKMIDSGTTADGLIAMYN